MIKDTAKTDTEKRVEYLLECHSDTVHAIAYYTKKRNEITAELISLRKSEYEQETGHKVGFLKDESVEVRAVIIEAIKAANRKGEQIDEITLVVKPNIEDSYVTARLKDRKRLEGLTRYAIETLERQRYGKRQVKYVG